MGLDILRRGADEAGIELSAAQLEQFTIFAAELTAWNRRVNLTRVVDWDQIQVRHLLDSLSCALPIMPELATGPTWTCIDVGSGAGFPGLPLAIAYPSLAMVLLEATRKRATFLAHVVATLSLARVSVVNARAEHLARQDAHRDRYDLALARALAPLPVALELCLPFVRPGGRLILPRGSDLKAQLESGRAAAGELGARLSPAWPVELRGVPAYRALVVAEKVAPTSLRYPRRTGVAAKRPLGCPKAPLA